MWIVLAISCPQKASICTGQAWPLLQLVGQCFRWVRNGGVWSAPGYQSQFENKQGISFNELNSLGLNIDQLMIIILIMLISRLYHALPLRKLAYNFTAKKFNLPDLGQKIKEGKIQKWYVKAGENVQQYQKLADITSDKQFTQLTASDTGLITKLFHQEGEVCQVGEPLFEIDVKEEGASSPPSQQSKQHPVQKEQKQHQSVSKSSGYEQNRLLATPAVRNLLKTHNIEITNISGTGKDGRVVKEDVLAYIQNKNTSKPKSQDTSKQSSPQKQPLVSGQISKKAVEMNSYDKGMQKTMSQSSSIPHLSYHQEFDLTDLMQFREKSKNFSKEKITYMSYFIKTFSLALSHYPKLNSWYNPESPFEYSLVDNHNITIAIDTPNGLAVPNIKNVQNLKLNRLIKAAKDGRIERKDIEGGTISISNIGTVGGTYARPLILSPQVAIVALGKTRRLPRFQSETSTTVSPRNIMSVSFSADHRVIDGGTVANFSNKWKQYLENPALILLELK